MKKCVLLVFCLAVAAACQQNRNQVTEAPIPKPTQAVSTEPSSPSAAQPTAAEVRAAIQRNYADAVALDNSSATPFILGDFNGDNSEDIAIVVKPRSEKLSELNSEFVNWILEDPRHSQQVFRGVKAKDTLLAVIHGQDRQGWRNELARQTYLLKNAGGTELASQSVNQLSASGETRALPQLRGDVIREKLNGSGGIIYWTGAKYAWHPAS
jgi:hypothetical protein